MYKNSYATEKSVRIGSSGENSFASYAKSMGWEIHKSTKFQDMKLHIDAFVKMYGVEMSVDIKGIKDGVDEGLITIELMNVQGKHGWLYGEANIIAFQIQNDEWILVDRKDLVDLVHEKMMISSKYDMLDPRLQSRNKFCSAPNWYRRRDRMDAVTNLSIKEVKEIA